MTPSLSRGGVGASTSASLWVHVPPCQALLAFPTLVNVASFVPLHLKSYSPATQGQVAGRSERSAQRAGAAEPITPGQKAGVGESGGVCRGLCLERFSV